MNEKCNSVKMEFQAKYNVLPKYRGFICDVESRSVPFNSIAHVRTAHGCATRGPVVALVHIYDLREECFVYVSSVCCIANVSVII